MNSTCGQLDSCYWANERINLDADRPKRPSTSTSKDAKRHFRVDTRFVEEDSIAHPDTTVSSLVPLWLCELDNNLMASPLIVTTHQNFAQPLTLKNVIFLTSLYLGGGVRAGL